MRNYMKGFEYLQDVATLKLDREGCIGCGMCIEVCPHQIFVLHEGKASIAAINACMECGACAVNCPVQVIEVDSGVGCASGLITEWLRSLKISSKSSGC